VAGANKPVIAVLNASTDVLELLQEALEDEGFVTVRAAVPEIKRGSEDFVAFLKEHDPAAIVYDVSPPYEENWTFLRLLRDTEAAKGRPFVITTTNKRALEAAIGATDAHEVIGKPYDLQEIVKAVHDALAARR